MIVVVGRPALVPSSPGESATSGSRIGGLAGRVALAARAQGAEVQLVGAIGDDLEGDAVAVELSRAGIGHAALLRDPAGRTPVEGSEREPLPRLDAADIGLGLSYVPDCRVLVVVESLSDDAERVVVENSDFHAATLIAVETTTMIGDVIGWSGATVFGAPDVSSQAFADMLGRYAAAIDAGQPPDVAFESGRRAAGWESEA